MKTTRRSFLKSAALLSAATTAPTILTRAATTGVAAAAKPGRELKADVLIIGASISGLCAAAYDCGDTRQRVAGKTRPTAA